MTENGRQSVCQDVELVTPNFNFALVKGRFKLLHRPIENKIQRGIAVFGFRQIRTLILEPLKIFFESVGLSVSHTPILQLQKRGCPRD